MSFCSEVICAGARMICGRLGGGASPGNRLTTPFPCFLSMERGCSEAEQGLPCEIGRISQGREKVEKRVVRRVPPPHLSCRHG
jgi:hypothetical protein